MLQELLSIYASIKVISVFYNGKKELEMKKQELEKKKQELEKSINDLLEIEVNIDFLKEFHDMLKCEARRFIKCIVLAWKIKTGEDVDMKSDYASFELELWDELRDEYDKNPYNISQDKVDTFFNEMPLCCSLGDIINEYDFCDSSFIKFLFGLWVMGALV